MPNNAEEIGDQPKWYLGPMSSAFFVRRRLRNCREAHVRLEQFLVTREAQRAG